MNGQEKLARLRQAEWEEKMRLKAIKKYKSAGKVVVPGSRFQGKLIRPIEVVVLRLPHCATYDGASRSYREMVPEVEARATPNTT